jgi:hypothetical protein
MPTPDVLSLHYSYRQNGKKVKNKRENFLHIGKAKGFSFFQSGKSGSRLF